MKNPILMLFLVTAIAGLMVGFANHITLPQILLHAEGAVQENLRVVYPQATRFEDATRNGSDTVVYLAIRETEVLGHVIIAYGMGYINDVQVLVGINSDGVIDRVVVGAHSETPGIGTRIEEPDFLDQFIGMTGPIRAVFTEPGEGEIASIASVTVTVDAAVIGVNNALVYFNENIAGGSS